MLTQHRVFRAVTFAGLSLILLVSLIASSSRASASIPNSSSLDHPYASLYQPILNAFLKKGHPGVSVLVRTAEEGTWDGTAGYARIEDKTPVRPDHLFASLSCAKAYTAAAVFMLWEEGLIDLDACIDSYLEPEICDQIANGHTATVRHLLNHTSGIPDSDENRPILEIMNDLLTWTWRDDLEGIYDMPPLFTPGTGLAYRSSNYILLAVIMDRLIGNHALFFTTRLFQPLGLADTYYKLEAGLPRPPKMANLYFDRYGDGRLENVTDELCIMQFNSSYGSAGLLADVSDSARFMEALIDGEVIGPEALAQMTAPAFPGQEWRGSGIYMIDYQDSLGRIHRCYEMAGSGPQGMAQIRYFPAEQVTISCATNVGSTNRPKAHDHFYALINDLTAAVFNGRNETLSEADGRTADSSSGRTRIQRIR